MNSYIFGYSTVAKEPFPTGMQERSGGVQSTGLGWPSALHLSMSDSSNMLARVMVLSAANLLFASRNRFRSHRMSSVYAP